MIGILYKKSVRFSIAILRVFPARLHAKEEPIAKGAIGSLSGFIVIVGILLFFLDGFGKILHGVVPVGVSRIAAAVL